MITGSRRNGIDNSMAFWHLKRTLIANDIDLEEMKKKHRKEIEKQENNGALPHNPRKHSHTKS